MLDFQWIHFREVLCYEQLDFIDFSERFELLIIICVVFVGCDSLHLYYLYLHFLCLI